MAFNHQKLCRNRWHQDPKDGGEDSESTTKLADSFQEKKPRLNIVQDYSWPSHKSPQTSPQNKQVQPWNIRQL